MSQLTPYHESSEFVSQYRRLVAYGEDPDKVLFSLRELFGKRNLQPSFPILMHNETDSDNDDDLPISDLLKKIKSRKGYYTQKVRQDTYSDSDNDDDLPISSLVKKINGTRNKQRKSAMVSKAFVSHNNVNMLLMASKPMIVNHSSTITITPISGDPKNKAYIDYEEQKRRNQHIFDGNMFWCWDDSKTNKTCKGQLFAFYLTKHKKRPLGKYIIHRVENVKSPTQRLPSWSNNVGQGDRNVLELSPPLLEILIDDWIYIGGPMSKLGTYITKGKTQTFLTELQKRIMMSELGFI